MTVRTPCPCPKGWDCEIIRQADGGRAHRRKWHQENERNAELVRSNPDAFPPGHPLHEKYARPVDQLADVEQLEQRVALAEMDLHNSERLVEILGPVMAAHGFEQVGAALDWIRENDPHALDGVFVPDYIQVTP